MRKVLLTREIALARLNAKEYLNLMTRMKSLIEDATATALGMTDEEFAEFSALVDKFYQRIYFPEGNELTDSLNDLEGQRDAVITYLFQSVRNGISLPIEEQAEAAKALEKITSLYAGLQRMPEQQETVAIAGLLLKLDEEAAKAHLATMNLTAIVAKLKSLNDEYAAQTKARTRAKGLNEVETVAEMRAALDPMYQTLTIIAQSKNVLEPTETTAEFMAVLNETIKEVNQLYNKRMGKEDKEDEETEIPGTDPGTSENPGGEQTPGGTEGENPDGEGGEQTPPTEPDGDETEGPKPGEDTDGDGSPEVV